MRVTSHHLTGTILGLAAILSLGCDDPVAPDPAGPPNTGAIEVSVSTQGANPDVDPDGYALSISGRSQNVGVNTAVTIANLPTGNYFVLLNGLAPNCRVDGTNPRLVGVVAGKAASRVSFSVSCLSKEEIDSGAGDWDY